MYTFAIPLQLTLQRQYLIERAPARAWRRVVRDLVAVQAQYETAGALGLNARVEGLTQAGLTNALYRNRSLLKMWAMRGTLHYVLPEDWKLFIAVHGSYYQEARKDKVYNGISFADREAWLYPAILEALADGPLTYKQILGRLQALAGHRHSNLAGFFDSWGGIMGGMCLLGYVVLVDSAGAATRVVRADHWLKPEHRAPYEGPPEAAVIELLIRYLKTYGPASQADFRYWAGCAPAHARQAWAALASRLSQIPASGPPLYMLRSDVKRLAGPQSKPPVRLLPKFDAMTLMYKDKSRVMDMAHYKQVFRIAAQVEATLLVGGRLAGTWRYRRRGRTLAVEVFPFGRVTRAAQREVEAEAGRVARFFDLEAAEVNFQAPQ